MCSGSHLSPNYSASSFFCAPKGFAFSISATLRLLLLLLLSICTFAACNCSIIWQIPLNLWDSPICLCILFGCARQAGKLTGLSGARGEVMNSTNWDVVSFVGEIDFKMFRAKRDYHANTIPSIWTRFGTVFFPLFSIIFYRLFIVSCNTEFHWFFEQCVARTSLLSISLFCLQFRHCI